MNVDVYIFLRFVVIFQNFLSFLCSVLRVSPDTDPSRDRDCEPQMLPPDDLGWLDEGIRRSDESGGDGDNDGNGGDDDGSDGDDNGYRGDGSNDEETHGVGGSQRDGAMT